MFVELVYDKRNVQGLEGAREIILAELTSVCTGFFLMPA
ncbi:Virulence protein msgA [Enterobacter hormaechei]|nr:Virulence protein msgA [Enterobacter hormaechei]